MNPTHSELVALAAGWLRKKNAAVVTEIATSGEEPDALGWPGTTSTLIECKASRSDFLADKQKQFRRQPERGIGRRRYFMAPQGLIDTGELPSGWGLLEVTGTKVRQVIQSIYFEQINEQHEIGILLSVLRRLGPLAPQGTSIRFYSITSLNRATCEVSDMAEDWV